MNSRRTVLKAGAALGAAAYLGAPRAQSAPKNIRLVIGFLPGGLTDIIARHLAEGLNRLNIGYNVIVDAKPGASGRISVANVKSSPADGAQFLLTPANVLTLLPHVFKNVDYDSLNDFVAVNAVFSFAYCFSVGPAVPGSVKTLKDYLAWAKANPAKASYAGVLGAPQHLLTAYLAKMTDTPLTLVSYKGGGPLMVQDVLRGDVPAVGQVTADAMQWQGQDKLRTLATFTRARTPFLPDAPTIGEAGFPDLVAEEWGAVFAVKGTPQPIITRMSEAIQQVVNQPSFRTAMATQASVPNPGDAQQIARSVREDHAFWRKVIVSTGVTLE